MASDIINKKKKVISMIKQLLFFFHTIELQSSLLAFKFYWTRGLVWFMYLMGQGLCMFVWM